MLKSLRTCSLLLALAVLTVNCSEDKEKEPEPVVEEVGACYLTREVFTNPNLGFTQTREFVYANDQLTTINETVNLPAPKTLNIVAEYDGSGRVARTVFLEQGQQVQYYTFEYDAQNLLRKINLFSDPQRTGTLRLNSSRELGYNAQKQLITAKNYFLLGQAPLLTNDVSYTYDARGNMVRSREYRVLSFRGAEILADVVINLQYTHDDKINPLHEIPYLLYTNPNSLASTLSKNNSVTVVSATSLEGTVKGPGTADMSIHNYSRSFTHTYSAQNRPTRRTGADGTVTTFDYVCE
ncbi:hypothetical protein [Rufibacter psychrotolerans]|uniref:hypothetical protein n=1 Tax=Rufibacter psychrotolerans TaxID=2812556 RepID=UPI0019678382|nr:hypothetical protein [Rufibacter sp. SYSU D00308]